MDPLLQNRHTVFVDDESEARAFDPAAHFDTAPELLDRSFNRPRRSQLADPAAVAGGGEAGARLAARVERKKAAAYRELLQRQERQVKLGTRLEALVAARPLLQGCLAPHLQAANQLLIHACLTTSPQASLGGLAAQLSYQKEVAGKGRKRKLRPEEAGGQAGVFRWKAERKK